MAKQRDQIETEVWDIMTRLLDEQLVGVLGSFDGARPYTSIVGFAVFDGYREIILATPRATRKFANLTALPQASFLIDNRSNSEADFHAAVAVTARGGISEFNPQDRPDAFAHYLRRHPYLEDFVRSPSCAMLCICVTDYLVVQRFQDVTEIMMPDGLNSSTH